ncbi:MAG: hypothetical protein CL780_04380 [Chloroflexi bacterium]|nr:hypothetical protein [Chloroflexota bacterium]|tara:strand:- start:267 stop:809 length:543 start_codon:yes stop_codon:yes gene_type:complete
MEPSTNFLLINIIGGILVISSYFWGYIKYPFHRNLLWGSIGLNFQKVFVLSMICGMLGYLVSAFWFWKIINHDNFIFGNNYDFHIIITSFSFFLGISALWMPMAIKSLISKNKLYINITKLILVFVAILSLFILYSIVTSNDIENNMIPGKNIPIIGWAILSIHTVIFDCVIWSFKFNPE